LIKTAKITENKNKKNKLKDNSEFSSNKAA
jgi:hypothetical protein